MNEEKNVRDSEEVTEVKKLGMVKKQKIMLIAFASFFAALLLVYFLVILPIYKDRTAEDPIEPPVLLDGEAYGDTGYNIVVFPHIAMNDIKSVKVKNSYGEYTFLKANDDEFYVEEHPLAPIGAEAATAFAVDAGYLVASRRVVDNCEDFSLYGLSDADQPATFTLTTLKNVVYTFYIGDEVPTGEGYYCRYKGRNAVYVISSQVSETLLAPATAMITPILVSPMEQTAYLGIKDFIMTKNGESFLYIRYNQQRADEAENGSIYIQSVYDMLYPASYLVNDTDYTGVVLASFVSLQGESVVAAGTLENPLRMNERVMEEYGFFDLENTPYEIYYTYESKDADGNKTEETELITFAPSGVDGYYFAYSYKYDIIVLISEDTVPYLEWDLLKYVNPTIYSQNITDVKEISVEGNLKYRPDGAETSKVYKVDERFNFTWVEKSDTITDLECYAHSTGKTVTGTKLAANPVQSFYASLLWIEIGGYVKDDEVDIDELEEYACITVTYTDDTQSVYRFYRYANRCVYTLNGSREFYVNVRSVDKVIIDGINAAWGDNVDLNEEYPKLNQKYLEAYAEKNG